LKYIWIVLLSLGVAACGESGRNTASSEAAPPDPGEDTYNKFCFSCHAAGIAGAPRTGDVQSWAPRVAKGRAVLLQSAVEGMPPGMPPMGLCMQCSEAQLAAAIDYMLPEELAARNSEPAAAGH